LYAPRNAGEMSWWIGAIFLAESRFFCRGGFFSRL
jgi:hypothetical protein